LIFLYDHLITRSTTTSTGIFVTQDGIALLGELDDPVAFGASGRFVGWGILQYVEVVFICAVVDIHLRFKRIPAPRTGLPIAAVFFRMVIGTQRVSVMVPETAAAGI
jgi:hypothetical protein